MERSLNHAYATARARSRTCTVEEGLYGPEHVQALATHWGLEEAATRTRIEQKLMARDRNGIESALAAAGAPVPNLQALWNGVTRRGLEAAGRPPVDCRPGHCWNGWVNAVNGRLDPVQ